MKQGVEFTAAIGSTNETSDMYLETNLAPRLVGHAKLN